MVHLTSLKKNDGDIILIVTKAQVKARVKDKRVALEAFGSYVELDSSHIALFSSGAESSSEEASDFGTLETENKSKHFVSAGKESDLRGPAMGSCSEVYRGEWHGTVSIISS
ncbi:hypothetical protein VNO78_12537 [Psophocarpus tetragonolobus]|uniref:Uncharacterized protein n=1 Tax=Psophocarpus tetragonolobus TaxID=3891 RepID=A0AAN9XPI5_PSOTE